MGAFIGVNQSPDIDKTMKVVEKYVLQGYKVQIRNVHFIGALTDEHPYPLEYEVYVDFED